MPRVFGWGPSQQDEEADVHRPKIITFSVKSESSDKSSTNSPPSHIEDEEEGRRRPRKGDPDFVPRPKNSFFIFRNQYVRQNARRPNAVKARYSSLCTDRSMSRRAGDAWRALSQSERNHFKALAEVEKHEHAQAHPGYRFRPAKRARVSPKAERASLSHPTVPDSPYQSNIGAEDTPRAFKPRSSSVPLHVPAVHPPFLIQQEERLGVRRPRSYTTGAQSSSLIPSAKTYSGAELELDYSANSEFSLAYGPPSPSTIFPSSYPSPSLSATNSSSLAGWNGELLTPPLSRTPSYPMSATSTLSSWTSFPLSNAHLDGYQHQQIMFSDEPQAEQFYAGDYSGMKHSAAPPVYWCPQTCHEAFSPTTTLD